MKVIIEFNCNKYLFLSTMNSMKKLVKLVKIFRVLTDLELLDLSIYRDICAEFEGIPSRRS